VCEAFNLRSHDAVPTVPLNRALHDAKKTLNRRGEEEKRRKKAIQQQYAMKKATDKMLYTFDV